MTMRKKGALQSSLRIFLVASGLTTVVACTGQIPGSFRLQQQEESFSSQLQINTKIDLLWVVDNSSSMDVAQDKLRKGFDSFARKYMQPTWDIRVAVITTDTYLANPAFGTFLGQTLPSSGPPWISPYMSAKIQPVTNPIYDPATGMFPSGVKYRDLVPVWNSSYARLLPGIHDGPIAGLCFEGLPYFLYGVTDCSIRDDGFKTGVADCVSPAGGESAISECVNTVENNTVRSGKAIISTTPGAGVLGDPAATAAWTQQLVNDFIVNVTTGSVGFGSERGLSSLLQLVTDNEGSPTAFFRKGALRGIVFVSDEDDQSLEIPTSPGAGFSPFTDYACDQASLLAMNPTKTAQITGVNGLCCSTPGNNCRYGAAGTSCPSKTVDGLTFAVSTCPVAGKLIAISAVKSQLDSFFASLDQGSVDEAAKSYFIATITPTTASGISALQASRDSDDVSAGAFIKTRATDRGDRYIALGEAVGNGSVALDLSADDYSPVLDQIGIAIIENKSTFTLVRAPTSTEEMLVKVVHQDGSESIIPSSKYIVDGRKLIITDQALVLGFASTDQVVINYQPKTLY